MACLFRHEKAIEGTFSNLEKLSLQWLRLILYSVAIIMLIAVVLFFRRAYFDAVWLLVALLIYTMSYFTLKKPEVFSGLIEKSKGGKYQKSSLSPGMLEDYKQKIDKLMEEEKLFLDNEISLPLLADKMAIPVHHLSQIINQVYHQNFYEFISHYRIETAKEMMQSPEFEKLKIIEICFNVGFNTISAFNTSFRRITGLTPSQYKNSLGTKSRLP
jgi:AraC-like DNA-binding protein